MSMASIRPVNWDDIGARHRPVNWVDIGARFGAPAFSSGQGSHVCHSTPQAQSQKKTKKALATPCHSSSSARLPPQPSIPEGFAMKPISSVSSTESRAAQVESQVRQPVENAPAESSPGTGSTSDNQMFRRIKEKISKMIKKLKQKLARLTQ